MNYFEYKWLVPVDDLNIQRRSTYDPSCSILGTLAAWEVTA